ncbi:MAG TPA: response regulator transcription factor [Thiobacillaceae bacterium]|nr:response regulator transcription factor [Thiobacillaceae bacterium]HNA80953.1 response regulator transcription factor [Thiobacillaceae bacterium]HNF88224.1 response regulator transcription factor [Thiobacillaceae bacterium]HNH88780.1 response regulator transcription factor [Thiobacillaceae bacterium]HNI07892.1 response regulator transcription factor [Thiobacillaceae bacterium]
MKIILADDHALFRGGFALLFQQLEFGAEVLEASSLDEAMELVERHPDTELLLLDLNMPGMNGPMSIARIAAAYPQLPVVVLSANDSRPSVWAVMEAGASGFIPKSSSSAVMQSAIRLILSGGIYLPPQLLPTFGENQAAGSDRDHSARLTGRQLEVLRLLVSGMPNKQICRELGLGEGTVKVHVAAIFRALEVGNRTEAAQAARRLGLVE